MDVKGERAAYEGGACDRGPPGIEPPAWLLLTVMGRSIDLAVPDITSAQMNRYDKVSKRQGTRVCLSL